MSRKTLLPALLVAALTTCIAGTSVAEVRRPLGLSLEASAAKAPASPRPVELIRAWDARRAEAWARGDPSLLRSLYTPGSVAGRRDRAMLRAWTARGLVVQGMDTQLLSVRVLAHTPTTWTLQVTDRLVGGVAMGADLSRPLPHDQATTRIVRLTRLDGEWRVASVLPQDD